MLNAQETRLANPYIGPRSFKTGETLYGRGLETRRLLDLLIAERIVLLHSPSGAGKSSLIRAGLVPLVEAEGFRVLPVVRVNLDVPPTVTRPGRVNRYVFSFMLSCEEALPEDQRLPIEQLAAISIELGFLNRRARVTFDRLAGLGTASGPEREPTPLADGPVGAKRIRSLEDYLVQRLQVKPEEDCVLILDQFEEILTANPNDLEVKTAFFEQLGAVLRNRRRWALFAMREDYMGGLTPFQRHIPSRFSNTFRLDLLSAEAAKEALQQPAHRVGVDFTDKAAQKLVDDLRRVQVQNPDGTLQEQLGPTVEPVQLQVVGYRLWASLAADTKVISIDNVASVGTVDQSLADYYAGHAAATAQETGVKERAIRQWFAHQLITEEDLRSQVLLGVDQSEGLDNRAVRRLENAHLIRAEKRVGATWFELAHDRLIRPIKANNTAWFHDNLSLLQRQAELWHTQNHPEGLLLRHAALAEAEAWAAAHADEMTPVEQDFLEACRKARALSEREHRRNRLMRFLAAAASVAAVAALVFGAVSAVATQMAVGQSNQRATAIVVAEQQRQLAEQQRLIAVTSQAQAVTQEANAERQRRLAVTAQAQAVTQEAYAEQQRRLAVTAQAQALSQQANAEAASTEVAAQANMRATSEAATRETLSQLYASQAHESLDADLGLALLLGVEAYNVYPSPEASRVLSDGVALSRQRAVQLYGRQPLPQHPIRSLVFNPAGDTLAWGGNDNTVVLWNVHAMEVAARQQASSRSFITPTLAYSPDGRMLAWAGQTGAVTLWDPQRTRTIASLYQIVNPIYALAFSPDGLTLAAGTLQGKTVLWSMADRSVKGYLTGLEGDILSLAWARDGRLATGGSGGVRIWNTKTNETIVKLSGVHTDTVTSLVWSVDGNWLASGSIDGTIVFWNAATGRPLAAPVHTGAAVFSLALNPSGNLLASGLNDQTIALWDITSLNNIRRIAQIVEHASTVNSLAFSAKDNLLASGDQDGYVYIHQISTEQTPNQPLPSLACALAKRNFTQAEWSSFFPGKAYHTTCAQWPAGE
jgi:hypothetical protein